MVTPKEPKSSPEQAAYWLTLLDQDLLNNFDREKLKEWLSEPANRMAFNEHRALASVVEDLPRKELVLRSPPRHCIKLVPGCRITAIARFLLPETLFRRYVWPAIADMQWEYIRELEARHLWRARWIVLRGHLLLIPGWVYASLAGKLYRLVGHGK